RRSFDLLAAWSPYIKPGTWPDADMLPVGLLSLGGRPHGEERYTKFTLSEQYTLLSLWIISRSPLMLGADLRQVPPDLYEMLTNPEVLAVNASSSGNREVYRDEKTIAWMAEEPDSGDKYLALFNISDEAGTVIFDLTASEMEGEYAVRDLWKRSDAGEVSKILEVSLEAHGAALFRLKEK
ncbi:MAG: hypothetical protein IH592_14010, partial [Bacteroidales bacterium]|nr:hypothetical protein [Bacteroidales bacterium]